MDNAITQVGVGGIFAMMVLRMVFDFLDKRRKPEGSIVRPWPSCPTMTDYSGAQKELLSNTLSATVLPILQNQVSILNELRSGQLRQQESVQALTFMTRELKETAHEDFDALRKGNHDVRDALQGLVIRLQPVLGQRT